jgi:competence protein ComEC
MRLFVLVFVLGTLALQHASELPGAWGIGAGAAALLALHFTRRHTRLRALLLLAAGFLLGFGNAAWRAQVRLADELPIAWEGRDIALEGIVASLPQPGERGTRFLFDVGRVFTPGAIVPPRIALTWYADATRDDGLPPRLVPGERWSLTARLKRPRGLANPHTFDFEPWALERGIRATGYVRPKAGVARGAIVDGWPYTLHRGRAQVRDRMLAHLGDARLRGVLVALAIGDQDAIAAADWEVFWRTGVGHLMSISGLHITMLAGLGYLVVHGLWARAPALALRVPARHAALVAGTLAALAYSLMTGYAVPAQRTFVMLAVVAACVLAGRHGSPSRVLALAALAVLALDPWAVLSAGFWLSFGAVAAIFFVMALRTGRAGRWRTALAEQAAVTVLMVPMLVALFHEVSWVSPLANAVAIPVVSLAIVPLAIAGAFLPLPVLLDAAHALMLALMAPLEALAAWPLAMLESHGPRGWTVAAALVGCAWLLAPRGVPMRAAALIWFVPLFAVVPPRPAWGEAWLEVLDVGNGLAVVVRTATHALAYDAGPAWSAESDGGNRIVTPFLRGEGVGRLDTLVVSHADGDHAGGAISLAAARAPAWLLSPLPAGHPLRLMFDDTRRCEAGARWDWDGVAFSVLHPAGEVYAESPQRGARKENDRSCVLRVATEGAAALLTGDVEARAEGEMLARDRWGLRADVLLVPHHGSKTSSSADFVDAVAPAVAIMSVGHRNRFGHPHAAVVARYAGRGVALRRTDREGALRVVLPAESSNAPRVEPLVRQVRYWSERRPR